MERKPEQLYLELMKNALSFALWPEPPIPIGTFNHRQSAPRRFLTDILTVLLRSVNLQLSWVRHVGAEQKIQGGVISTIAHTMIGLKRLENLQFCIESAINEKIEGDFIETGVWRGGACIFMRAVLAAYGIDDRRVIVADSFEGLPKPDPRRWPADERDKHYRKKYLAISEDEVRDNFRKYGLLDDQVVFIKGWFQDTLPTAPIEKLAVLRLDGDMYGSTMDALTNLYPKLSSRGFCIIDDYALRGCRQAVDDFRVRHGIKSEMRAIDWTGAFWRKE